jgi:hypothetical protein
LPKPQLEDFLFAENCEDKTFLHSLLERPDQKDDKNENSDDSDCDDNKSEVQLDKHKGYYQIFCRTVIQLHETIAKKDKLKSLLEQKYKESSNLIKFVTENCLDIGFFIDWLKQHPEYPAPSEFKQSTDGFEQSSLRNPLENADEIAIENQIEASGQSENISIDNASSLDPKSHKKKEKCICF